MKYLLGLIAIALTFLAFIPYILSIKRGETKPHVFSWIIWGSATFIVFLAQYAAHGGAGSWSTGVSGIITFYVAYLAYQVKADLHITRTDWIALIIAFTAIPIWAITHNPLWAVVILTTIDSIGFWPTLRKAWHKPFEEKIWVYAVMNIRNIVTIFALEDYSLTTLLFPITMTLTNGSVIAVILIQRKK